MKASASCRSACWPWYSGGGRPSLPCSASCFAPAWEAWGLALSLSDVTLMTSKSLLTAAAGDGGWASNSSRVV
eukprot:4246141-Pyramimonas_sp.AAC.1